MYTVMTPKLIYKRDKNNKRYLNVITVDWTGGVILTGVPAAPIQLGQTFGNARLVAAQISYLIKQLISRKGLSCDSTHIIGFSLGASIAGVVGKGVNTGNEPRCHVARITGESHYLFSTLRE